MLGKWCNLDNFHQAWVVWGMETSPSVGIFYGDCVQELYQSDNCYTQDIELFMLDASVMQQRNQLGMQFSDAHGLGFIEDLWRINNEGMGEAWSMCELGRNWIKRWNKKVFF